jgi:FkbM family methyltransferase
VFSKLVRKTGLFRAIQEVASFANQAKNGRWYPAGGETIMTTIYTEQIIAVSQSDVSLAPHLILKGIWEMELSRKCESLISSVKDPVIFDVGANFGWYGLILSRFSGQSAVHFFEANPLLAKLIEKTILVNGLTGRSSIVNCAVGADDDSLMELNVPKLHMGSASVMPFAPGQLKSFYEKEEEMQTFKVPTRSLDRYCKSSGIACINFLKIDVEGAEGDVLLGAKNIISKSPDLNLMMEWNVGRYPDEVMGVLKQFSKCEGLAADGKIIDLSQIFSSSSTIHDFEGKAMIALSKSFALDLFFMKK